MRAHEVAAGLLADVLPDPQPSALDRASGGRPWLLIIGLAVVAVAAALLALRVARRRRANRRE